MKHACRLNSLACFLKMEEFVKARDMANEFLREYPGNAKALYRRASAALSLGDFDDALRDLRRVLEVEPANADARRLFAEAVRKGKEESRRHKEALDAKKQ
eukprot:TRINITY_DN14877_c0_g1_i2.p2 TRINITY_DN14877_c0_g1~~TRINITY_DN14877_c0_g1_i2.p2  ORF type:complete len:101 (-),score=33.60 TRINITY_DN14877_c0_g1_i2:19-321(-)